MWVGTSGGVVRYDTATHEYRTYNAGNGLFSNSVFHLGKLRGKIAVGTFGGGLSLLDQTVQKWEHYNIPEGLGDAFVYDVLEASNGDVWIATGSGVNHVRGGALRERAKWQLHTVESTDGGLPSDRVYALAQGKDGGLWFATEGGLARFHRGKWSNWSGAKGLDAPRDEAGSDGAAEGTYKHAKPSTEVRSAGTKGATPLDHVTALEAGRRGEIWAGTRDAGLARFDGVTWKSYTVADGLPSNQVSALHFDGNGQLWIGTEEGLAVFRDGKFRIMTTADGLLAGSVRSVTTTADGSIWVGTFGGVAYIRPPGSN
jgi:ligand-binding sensor domain-containing protein